jgi:hypothetical protein
MPLQPKQHDESHIYATGNYNGRPIVDCLVCNAWWYLTDDTRAYKAQPGGGE